MSLIESCPLLFYHHLFSHAIILSLNRRIMVMKDINHENPILNEYYLVKSLESLKVRLELCYNSVFSEFF